MEASRLVLPYCKNIDLNLGCPQGIARKGQYGAFLLSNYDQIEKIVCEFRMEKIQNLQFNYNKMKQLPKIKPLS